MCPLCSFNEILALFDCSWYQKCNSKQNYAPQIDRHWSPKCSRENAFGYIISPLRSLESSSRNQRTLGHKNPPCFHGISGIGQVVSHAALPVLWLLYIEISIRYIKVTQNPQTWNSHKCANEAPEFPELALGIFP